MIEEHFYFIDSKKSEFRLSITKKASNEIFSKTTLAILSDYNENAAQLRCKKMQLNLMLENNEMTFFKNYLSFISDFISKIFLTYIC